MTFVVNKKVVDEVCQVLNDNKALDVEVLDVSQKTNITKYFVLATASSNPHLKKLLEEALLFLKRASKKEINMKHLTGKGGNWVAIDGGDVVIHLFKDESRKYYDLESLWKFEI